MNERLEILHWEDFEVGRTIALGEKHVTREEIVAFATEFDPQPFHLDDEAAKDTMLDGLAASGWHSCAILMRMMCDGYLLASTSLGSPGLDEIKWLKPVRPGDTLKARYTCLEARPSGSRPNVGICKILYELHNQQGELVMTWHCNQFFGRRGPGGAS
ncbi:MAG: MaoC family dehydratase [Hyphomicrobiales bacterium]|nr:MaoC family dehydratase [Hyphomicrobiales bacterium]